MLYKQLDLHYLAARSAHSPEGQASTQVLDII